MGLTIFLAVIGIVFLIAVFFVQWAIACDNAMLTTSKGNTVSIIKPYQAFSLAGFRKRIAKAFNFQSRFSGSATDVCSTLLDEVSLWQAHLHNEELNEIINDTPEIVYSFGCNDSISSLTSQPKTEKELDRSSISKMSTVTESLVVIFNEEENRSRFLQLSNRKLKAYSVYIESTLLHYENESSIKLLIEAIVSLLFEGKISLRAFYGFIKALEKVDSSQVEHLLNWAGRKHYIYWIRNFRCINEVRQHTKLNAEFFEVVLKSIHAVEEKHSKCPSPGADPVVFEGYLAKWFVKMLIDLNNRKRLNH